MKIRFLKKLNYASLLKFVFCYIFWKNLHLSLQKIENVGKPGFIQVSANTLTDQSQHIRHFHFARRLHFASVVAVSRKILNLS